MGNRPFISATLYAEDGDKDICLLDANGIQGKPALLGKAAGLKVGNPVYAVGAPQGLELSLSDGIVAQLRGGPSPMIQTTAAVSPGSSGGGLFDGQGRLVGLTTFYLEGGQSLNFAMPVEWIGEVKPGRKPLAEVRSEMEWLDGYTVLETAEDWQGLLGWCQKWTKSKPENPTAWQSLGMAMFTLTATTKPLRFSAKPPVLIRQMLFPGIISARLQPYRQQDGRLGCRPRTAALR